MKITIIGHGKVGGALAMSWAKSGHTITIGTRNGQGDDKSAEIVKFGNVKVTDIASAVAGSSVILNATPAHIAVDLIEQMGKVEGKIIIDASNAISKKPEPFATAYHVFKEKSKARVVKAFNTTGFENMKNPDYHGDKIDLFMAGDDPEAKVVVRQLAKDAGFGEMWDFGNSDKVELLEKFALSWINLAIMQGYGRDIAIKILKR